ncbi:hypothetical protein VTK56DRAFT_8206 [Thermocarpiscus australiensis]
MAEVEDPITNKRKASPEPPAEDATAKRAKVGEGDETIDRDLSEPVNGTEKKDREEAHTGTPPSRENGPGAEQDSRHSPEVRRLSVTGGPPVRKSFSEEEKKRGQRLFGGLLSTLSRTTSGSQQQKRLEIERRQQEKAQQRRAEDDRRRAEKLEKLRRTRQIEQIKLDEQAMRTRHSTMLARAHSLRTRSEPKLYYLPYELTEEQEHIVKEQIRAAEETIDKETREFRERKEQRLKELGVSPPPRSPSPSPQRENGQQAEPQPEPQPQPKDDATVGEPKPPPQDTNPDAAALPPPKSRNVHDKDHDENGDEMMQDAEDTVIY